MYVTVDVVIPVLLTALSTAGILGLFQVMTKRIGALQTQITLVIITVSLGLLLLSDHYLANQYSPLIMSIITITGGLSFVAGLCQKPVYDESVLEAHENMREFGVK